MSCGVGCRHSSDLALLWHRLAATTPIQPQGWEPPYAMDAVLKRQKKKIFFSIREHRIPFHLFVFSISFIKENVIFRVENFYLSKLNLFLSILFFNVIINGIDLFLFHKIHCYV